MAESEWQTASEVRALTTLDIHYAMMHGCAAADFHRSGWTILSARGESDPMALLFGQRRLLSVIVPTSTPPSGSATSGIALVVPELRGAVSEVLGTTPPDQFFRPTVLRQVDELLRSSAGMEVTAREAAHQQVRFATAETYHPYLGQWLDWIEPLDEASEMAPAALSLLARYGRGTYVVRQRSEILAFAGLRQLSPHLWELGTRTAESVRGHGLARAVASRATRAALAAKRLPVFPHAATAASCAHLADALGYRLYANTLVYSART